MFNELKNLSLDCEILLLENARYYDIESMNMLYTESKSAFEKVRDNVIAFLKKIIEIIESFVDKILTKIKQAIAAQILKYKLSEIRRTYVNCKLEIDKKVKGKKFQLFDRIKYTREIDKAVNEIVKIIAKYEYDNINKMTKNTIKKSLARDAEKVEKLISNVADVKVTDNRYFKPAKDFKEILDSTTSIDKESGNAITKLKDILKNICGKAEKSVKSAKDIDSAEVYNYSEYRSLINKCSLFVKRSIFTIGHWTLSAIYSVGSICSLSNFIAGAGSFNPQRMGKGAAYGVAATAANIVDEEFVKPELKKPTKI